MTTPSVQTMLAKQKEIGSEATSAETPQVPEKEFQCYKASRVSMRIITPEGKKVQFVNFDLLTEDADVIKYLDDQIKCKGLPGITKGKPTTLAERDPMAMLRRKMKAEARAELEQEAKDKALGILADMGNTAETAKISPATTKHVAN